MSAIDIRGRIERAARMLTAAREEHTKGHGEDAQEFLRAAVRNLNQAVQMLDASDKVIELARKNRERV